MLDSGRATSRCELQASPVFGKVHDRTWLNSQTGSKCFRHQDSTYLVNSDFHWDQITSIFPVPLLGAHWQKRRCHVAQGERVGVVILLQEHRIDYAKCAEYIGRPFTQIHERRYKGTLQD